MLVLRIGRKARWSADRNADDPEHVAEAALDLRLEPGEEGLSVFRVEGEDDSREVAVRFALTCRAKPAHVDYVIFPDELAAQLSLTITPAPLPDLDPELSVRHHEINGLTPDLAIRLATAVLARADRRVDRVRDRDLPAFGAALCRRDPELRSKLRGEWAARLGPIPDDPPSPE